MKHSKEVEAVAKAIQSTKFPNGAKIGTKESFALARAALTAIREPTDGMCDALEKNGALDARYDGYRRAIDYALRDTTGEG